MSTTAQVDAYRNTLRSAIIATLIAAASLPLEVPRYGFWPLGLFDLLHGVEAVGIALLLVRYGKEWSVRTLDAVFIALVAPYLVTLWLPPVEELNHGLPAEPLLGHHFLILVLAIVSPSSYRLSLALVLVFTAEAVVLSAYLRERAAGAAIPREPYFTLLFAGIAVAVQWSVFRRRALLVELERAEVRSEAYARTARVLLTMRDRANSPLQTIEVGLSILEKRVQGQREVTTLLRSALRKLVDLQQAISELQPADGGDSVLTLDALGPLDPSRPLDPDLALGSAPPRSDRAREPKPPKMGGPPGER